MNYLMKYKGKYRILTELDQTTNDFVREHDDSLCDLDCYISCQNGNKIFTYGHEDNKKVVWLTAYVPSIGRGHNILKAVQKLGIEIHNVEETDSEILFRFKAKDIEPIAELMKAKTLGADISPFSSKNLPRSKVEIPLERIEEYKAITSIVQKSDLLLIHKLTTSFLDNVLQKKMSKIECNKNFDYKSDMKKLMLSRQTKEYIWVKNFFDEYLAYLSKEIKKFYNNKNK